MTASFTKNDKDRDRPSFYVNFFKVIDICVTYLLNKTEFLFFILSKRILGDAPCQIANLDL
jgi:hypothetical protein